MLPSAADRLDRLPDLKRDIQDILQIVSGRHATLSAVKEALAKDPDVTTQVILTANAGFFAVHQSVGTVDDAALKLGLSRIRILATATLLASRLPPHACPSFDIAGHWHRAISVALCVSKLANYVKVEAPPASLFLSALLHDVGLLVNAQAFPGLMHGVLQAHASDPSPGLAWRQREALGFDHHVAGAHALRAWGIHAGVPEVAEYHACPDYEGPCMRLVAMVRHCRAWYLGGFQEQPTGMPLNEVASAKLDNIGLSCQREEKQVETAARQLSRLNLPVIPDGTPARGSP